MIAVSAMRMPWYGLWRDGFGEKQNFYQDFAEKLWEH